ncbi:MAG TPA: molybdopterin-binding oxidoreductase, partial [Actinomycetota bacterium]|nr:molybdopterin-binding oxidoreductase [Actinomycetota bacterium]
MQGSSLRSGTSAREADRPRPRRWFIGGVVGLLSGAVALGVAQLAAGLVGGASSPMIAVGSTAIDATPEWLKSFAIRTFGAQDKQALLIGIGAVMAVAAALVGAVSVRRPRVGVIWICVFGGIGALASVTRPANGPADAIPSVIGTLAGLFAYVRLRAAAGLEPVRWSTPGTATSTGPAVPPPPGYDRRRFLRTGVAAAGLAAVSGFAGQYLVRRSDASASRAGVRIPAPADVAAPPPAGADLHVP